MTSRTRAGLVETLAEPPEGSPVASTEGLGRLDRAGWTALRYPPFVVFLASMLCSTTGNFIYIAALGWYVLGVTGSPAAVGLTFTVYGLPGLVFAAHAGVLTDQLGAQRMLVISMAGMAASTAMLAGLSSLPSPPFWAIAGLAGLLGVTQTLGAPAAVSIVSDLVPPHAVSSSVALNFLHMSLGRILGGVTGGLVLQLATPPIAFGICALMNALPAISLASIRSPARRGESQPVSSAVVRPVLEALRYVVRHRTLAVLLGLAFAAGLAGLTYLFMLPVAADELGAGPGGLGTLLAASGIGGLLMGTSLERVQRRIGHGRALFVGLAFAAAGLVAFGLAPGLLVASVALAIVGASILMYGAATVTLLGALSPARLRGRLMSLFAMFYWGMIPVGTAIVGLIAQASSARAALLLGGIGLAIAAALAWIARPQLATLAVTRDGQQLTGDLAGTGLEIAGR